MDLIPHSAASLVVRMTISDLLAMSLLYLWTRNAVVAVFLGCAPLAAWFVLSTFGLAAAIRRLRRTPPAPEPPHVAFTQCLTTGCTNHRPVGRGRSR